LGHHRSGERL